ncbi:hypothetical protein HDE_00028 [Halotydeus destructor]|nr:hypothetical protein HDE_00028 [Halotydeus destructor]
MSPGCQMRFKGSIVLMVCILVTSAFYCMVGDPKPSISSIVSETNRQLAKPLKKLKEVVSPAVSDSADYYLEPDQHKQENDVTKKYLGSLGFVEDPRLFPSLIWRNVTLPVLVSAVKAGMATEAASFIKSVHVRLPDYTLLLFDLGLDEDDFETISAKCNTTSCSVRKFSFDDYPSHVSDLSLSAFRPLIIQQVLNQAGAVIWLDPQLNVVNGASVKILPVIEDAQKVGIYSWCNENRTPTSAITHPKMFDYFKTEQSNYFFHQIVEPKNLVIFNTKKVHEELMLPWVKCALTSGCISPIGAQSSGCRFDKKPFFRYSGCHFYDASALNVILGIMFNFETDKYAPGRDKFFESVSENQLTPFPKRTVARR